MNEFTRRTDIVDWDHPAVLRQARELGNGGTTHDIAKRCFEWVRDEIQHSRDYGQNPVTWRASDVLLHRTGYCYAKSHLLAACLRANGIPAGFCYQRLSVNDAGPPFALHGYNAVKLPGFGWYRIDPRGNREGVNAQFQPPLEQLAFQLQSPGEIEFDNILPDPLDCVIEALRRSSTWEEVLISLPDVGTHEFHDLGLRRRCI